MLLVLIQRGDIPYVVNGPINPNTNKAFSLYAGQNIFVLAFFAANQRGANLDLRAFRMTEYRLYYLRRVLAGNLFATYPAVWLAHTGKK